MKHKSDHTIPPADIPRDRIEDEDDDVAPIPPLATPTGDSAIRTSSPFAAAATRASAAGRPRSNSLSSPTVSSYSRMTTLTFLGQPPGSAPRPSSAPRSPPTAEASGVLSSSGTAAAASPSPPNRIMHTYESLANRPRSNPRSRAPMRYESPLAPALNRTTVHDDDGEVRGGEHEQGQNQGGFGGGVIGERVTVRLGAGLAVGSTLRLARHSASTQGIAAGGTSSHVKSSKQGPSKRKIRRWNNDKFVGIASELAKSSSRGPEIAEAFLRGEAEAALYLRPNHPLNYRSEFARLVKDERGDLADIKERFVKGEVATSISLLQSKLDMREREKVFSDGTLMLAQIQPRLRNIVVRACASSDYNVMLVDTFEAFLVDLYSHGDEKSEHRREPDMALLERVLLCPPSVTKKQTDNGVSKSETKISVRFLFNAESSADAFHRLLLHAVCQFHSLHGASTRASTEENPARVLIVTGKCHGCRFRLVDVAKLSTDDKTETDPSSNASASTPVKMVVSVVDASLKDVSSQVVEPLSQLRVS